MGRPDVPVSDAILNKLHGREKQAHARLTSVLEPVQNIRTSANSLPTPLYSERATESLTAAERVLLEEYLNKLEQACANISSSVSKITVDIVPDPEENVRGIVVTSHFDVDAETAFAYWDIIGKDLDLWASGSEADTAAEVLELISTSVRWRK